jgi:hypothetical protein
MKHPKPRGSAINAKRVRSWRETFQSYRHTINDNTIDRWLDQFKTADKDLAARILDSVEFISSEQISSAFRAILSDLLGWNLDENLRTGKWRFIPFSGSAGESGDSMTHKFRHANGLSSKKYNDLFIYRSDLLREEINAEDNVVFIDDFSGTGRQVTENWSLLQELLPEQPNTYLILVAANNSARQRIMNETYLQVVSHYDFSESDNIFSPQCNHFSDEEKNNLLKYCKWADKRLPKGSGNCGMVLVFAHNSPNNSFLFFIKTAKDGKVYSDDMIRLKLK